MPFPDTPEQIKPHSDKYADRSWAQYSLFELYMWTHLYEKRATHRTKPDKADKDLRDADNYRAMLRSKAHAKLRDPSTVATGVVVWMLLVLGLLLYTA